MRFDWHALLVWIAIVVFCLIVWVLVIWGLVSLIQWLVWQPVDDYQLPTLAPFIKTPIGPLP